MSPQLVKIVKYAFQLGVPLLIEYFKDLIEISKKKKQEKLEREAHDAANVENPVDNFSNLTGGRMREDKSGNTDTK